MLKMTNAHYQDLEARIITLLNDNPDIYTRYQHRDFPRAEQTKDINKRFRWDLLHAVMPAREICDTYYPYLSDPHIDSALRKITADWPL